MPSIVPLNTDFSSLANLAYDQIKQKIFDFEILPGDLISEGNLAKIVSVSRTPLRQALQQLQHRGFIKAIPKIGWQITPLDFEKIDELYDFRILIESHAIKLICNSDRSNPALKSLQKTWSTPKSKRAYHAIEVGLLDEQFHSSIVAVAGNKEMLKTHSEITERIKIVRRLDFTKSNRIGETYDEHNKIIKSILSGRTAEAQRLLNAHISQSKIEVRKITLSMLQDARKKIMGE